MRTIHKNRTQEIRVRLREMHDRRFIDLRVFFRDDDGTMRPTSKGVALDLDHAENLIDAIRHVVRQDRPDAD